MTEHRDTTDRTTMRTRIRQLDELARAPAPTRRRLAAWATAEPALARLDYVGLRAVLADQTPPVDYRRRDELLAALVRLARTDPDAGLVIVVCMLPGLRRVVVRHCRGVDPAEAASVLVTALWQRIVGYPIERRPQRIAANLLLDALHDLTDWSCRERLRGGLHGAELPDAPAPEQGWSAGLIFHEAFRAGIVTEADIAVTTATRLNGHDLRHLAQQHNWRYEAIAKRRRRAEGRLAEWWAPEHHAPGHQTGHARDPDRRAHRTPYRRPLEHP